MTEKTHEIIIEILKNVGETPLLTNEIHARLRDEYKIDISTETVRRNLRHLSKMRVISNVLHPEKKTNAWIFGDVEKTLRSKKATNNKARMKHTKHICDKVIEPWQKNMPVVCWDGIFTVGPDFSELMKDKKEGQYILRYYCPKGENEQDNHDVLPNDVDKSLFVDFMENHINEELGNNPFVLWDRFNSLSHEYWNKFSELIEDIKKDLSKSPFELPENHACYPFLIREFILILWKKAEHSSQIQYSHEIKWAEKTPPKAIKLMKNLSYSQENLSIMEGLCKEHFQKIQSFIEQSLFYIHNDEQIIELIDMLKKSIELKRTLIETLKKYSYIENLPGNCPYL